MSNYLKNENILKHYTDQEKFLENPAYIEKFLLTEDNIIDNLLMTEINSLPGNFSLAQPKEISNHMRGKVMNAKNFILKIIGDYIISPTEFEKYYKPADSKHLTNFLLQTRIEVENKDGKYFRHKMTKYAADILPFFIKLYCHIPGVPPFVLKYKFKEKNLLNMCLANYFGQIDKIDDYVVVTLNKQNCGDLLNIINDPISTLISPPKTGEGKLYYVDYLGPDSPVYDKEKFDMQADDSWKQRYTAVYFP